MKHTIEIEGLPGGYEVKNIRVTENKPLDNGTIAALVYVKKKQPRRIVLEEAESKMNVDFYYKCKWWRIVEYSGGNND